MSSLLFAVGVVLLIAGPVMMVRGRAGRLQIRHELADQEIVFPPADALPDALTQYAGAQVVTGEQAKAFSDLIGLHVAKATGGRTYSQIVGEWQAAGRSDERLNRLRETAFMGQTLRGSLLGAYQAWQITNLVLGLGALLTAVGLVFVALGATGVET
jgi:hypothetical protein